MPILLLSELDVRACAPLDRVSLSAIEEAFSWTISNKVVMPPIMHLEIDKDSAIDVKSAYVSGVDHVAFKIASGFYNNPKTGLPSSSSTMVVVSALTGFCEAVLMDNGYLMDLRTGLAGGVAAAHLSRDNVNTVGIVGTGTQARYQVECLKLVRDIQKVLVFGRNLEKAVEYAREMSERLSIDVKVEESVAALAAKSDVIVTTTASTEPILQSDWIREGTHITAVGSDLPGKQEITTELVKAADLVVCDSIDQCKVVGELQHIAPRDFEKMKSDIVELGEIIGGQRLGRKSDEEVTFCDLTGMGVQDTAISSLVLERAIQSNMGLKV